MSERDEEKERVVVTPEGYGAGDGEGEGKVKNVLTLPQERQMMRKASALIVSNAVIQAISSVCVWPIGKQIDVVEQPETPNNGNDAIAMAYSQPHNIILIAKLNFNR